MTRATKLTAREHQVVAGVVRGLTNREIAAEIGISEQTVKNHLSCVYEKLHVKSRVQLAVLALRRGAGGAQA